MFKYVSTLQDSDAWIRHFQGVYDNTIPWNSDSENSVVVLKRDVQAAKGLDDTTQVTTVSPVEQTSRQAEVRLRREVQTDPPPSKRVKKPATNAASVTQKTKSIFTKDIVEKAKRRKKTGGKNGK
jgi:hypothetical protein